MAKSKIAGCVNGNSSLSKDDKETIIERVEHRTDALIAEGIDPVDAELLAAQEVLDDMSGRALKKVDKQHLKVVKIREMSARIKKMIALAKKRKLKNSAFRSLLSMFVPDTYNLAFGISLDTRIRAFQAETQAMMSNLMEKSRSTMAGLIRNDAYFERVVKALIDEAGDPDVMKDAQALRSVIDLLVDRFNEAGGSIRKLDHYGVYHSHSRKAIAKVSFDQWLDDITPLLDKKTFIHEQSGIKMTETEILDVMASIYEGILDDKHKLFYGGRGRVNSYKAVSEFHQNERYLHFKDGDSYLKYHKLYGDDSVYHSVMAKMHERIIQVASLEHFGPDPDDAVITIINWARDNYGLTDSQARALSNRWHVVSGGANVPVDQRWADIGRGIRAIGVSAAMGSAILPAAGDMVTTALTARWNQIGAFDTILGGFGQLGKMTNAEHRVLMGELMFGLDHAISVMPHTSRFGDLMGTGVGGRLAEFIIRVQGLQAWTIGFKNAHKMGTLNKYARLASKTWDELNEREHHILSSKGIFAKQWDFIRAAKDNIEDRYRIINPYNIDDRQSRHAFIGLLHDEAERAVPSPSSSTSALITTRGRQPGTVEGEIFRSVGMYNSYAAALFYNQLMFPLYNTTPKTYITAHYGTIALGLTGTGAFAIQATELFKGNDPASMRTPEFWLAAMHKGGFASYAGDFLFKNADYLNAGSKGAEILGPAFKFGYDVAHGLAYEPFIQASQGNEAKYFQRLSHFADEWTPGRSLWHVRAAMQGLLLDRIRELSGRPPRRPYGRFDNSRWMEKGAKIVRAPDFSAAFD